MMSSKGFRWYKQRQIKLLVLELFAVFYHCQRIDFLILKRILNEKYNEFERSFLFTQR